MLVNGKIIDLLENSDLGKLIQNFKINPSTIAIMLNGEIIDKTNLKIKLKENDEIELIKFVGGG